MTSIVFCDIETTGLDPQQDAIIEIALIKRDQELVWWVDLTAEELGASTTAALKVNRYYDRNRGAEFKSEIADYRYVSPIERRSAAYEIAQLTADCVLAGNTVKFDQQFLEVWLRRHGACPVWDYHVLDIPTFAAGVLAARCQQDDHYSDTELQQMREGLLLPFKSSRVSEALGIPEPEGEDKHTALADARWSKTIWDSVS